MNKTELRDHVVKMINVYYDMFPTALYVIIRVRDIHKKTGHKKVTYFELVDACRRAIMTDGVDNDFYEYEVSADQHEYGQDFGNVWIYRNQLVK